MAKKRKQYYRKKQKGVRYVTKALAKYFGKRYPNYSDRQKRARLITDQIKSSGNKVVLKNIFALERKPRAVKKTPVSGKDIMAGIEPLLTQSQKDLFTPQPFWKLGEYPTAIISLDQDLNITFVSDISPAGTDSFKAGDNIGYQEYFAQFVSYTNRLISKLQQQAGRKLTSDEIDYFVMTTPPDENGESRIISVDQDGNSNDWGFDPNNPDKEPLELIQPAQPIKPKIPAIEEEIEEAPAETIQPTTKLSPQEQIRLEELKTQQEIAKAQKAKAEADIKKSDTINKALEMLYDGKITHDQFDMIVSKL